MLNYCINVRRHYINLTTKQINNCWATPFIRNMNAISFSLIPKNFSS